LPLRADQQIETGGVDESQPRQVDDDCGFAAHGVIQPLLEHRRGGESQFAGQSQDHAERMIDAAYVQPCRRGFWPRPGVCLEIRRHRAVVPQVDDAITASVANQALIG
jgi:hypothetical protein